MVAKLVGQSKRANSIIYFKGKISIYLSIDWKNNWIAMETVILWDKFFKTMNNKISYYRFINFENFNDTWLLWINTKQI